MTLADLNTALNGITGVSHCYGFYPENQEAPYIAYNSTQSNPIFSDGQIVYSEDSVTLILVTRYRDLTTESTIDSILSSNGVQYVKTYDVDGEHKAHTTTYNFTL